MEPEPIRSAHKLRPFKPFTLLRASGESYHVVRPKLMSQSALGDVVVVMPVGNEVVMIDVAGISERASVFRGKAQMPRET